MRQVERFSGCTILTYAIMDNHFHILLAENELEELDDREFISRCRALYHGSSGRAIEREFERCKNVGSDFLLQRFKTRFLCRMHNVSEFMQTLLCRFSQWYNRLHQRRGPLWCGRFKSVLVEGRSDVLMTMARYIDLNPVRAGVVDDLSRYRWSGIGEALGGAAAAREGLKQLLVGRGKDWRIVCGHYLGLLAGDMSSLRPRSSTFPEECGTLGGRTVQGHMEKAIPAVEVIKHRVGYFSGGVILGSHQFLLQHQRHWNMVLRLKSPRAPVSAVGFDIPDLAVGRG